MFLLKAAALGLQNPQQVAVNYLGKVFGQVQTFRQSERAAAEALCRDVSKSGKLTVLIEFNDSWAIYSEGVTAPSVPSPSTAMAPAPVSPQATGIEEFRHSNQAEPQYREMSYRGGVVHKAQDNTNQNNTDQQSDTAEPQYREIFYRGAVIRKPINASTEDDPTKPRSYRGANY
jgi:hypothetical protein